MSRLDIKTPDRAQMVVEQLYHDMERRIAASPPGLCPVDMALNFLNLCRAQTCGKCVPCRIGLAQLSTLLTDVLEGRAKPRHMEIIEQTARVIVQTADCALGRHAAKLVLNGLKGFADDYLEHINNHRCLGTLENPVPCVALCPAGVDIPGYIALIGQGRCADAVRLIRKDNPFPTACAYICEHPCEARCRRNMLDDPMNIRGLKRYAVDTAGDVPQPACAAPTGKKVAVVGGMLRYGIPSYRFPRELLDREIASILSLGITAVTQTDIGTDIPFEQLRSQFDSVYIAIGAQTDKKTGIPGEDSAGVVSAVELLRAIGDNEPVDFTGKQVLVIGGGNVAMDVTRSAVRLGADKVSCVYRRRQADMTALPEEVEGAIAEGAQLLTLMAPVRIEADDAGHATALWVQPQMPGEIKNGRPVPKPADQPPVRIPADIIIVAIGQGIETNAFEHAGIPIHRGAIEAMSNSQLAGKSMDGVFAGGDCVTGPASAIRAIAAGKVAAANIDEYLGFRHEITVDVVIPDPEPRDRPLHGRVNTTEREAAARKGDFACIECGLTRQGALEESSRCLRCDHFGYGIFKGGRKEKW